MMPAQLCLQFSARAARAPLRSPRLLPSPPPARPCVRAHRVLAPAPPPPQVQSVFQQPLARLLPSLPASPSPPGTRCEPFSSCARSRRRRHPAPPWGSGPASPRAPSRAARASCRAIARSSATDAPPTCSTSHATSTLARATAYRASGARGARAALPAARARRPVCASPRGRPSTAARPAPSCARQPRAASPRALSTAPWRSGARGASARARAAVATRRARAR